MIYVGLYLPGISPSDAERLLVKPMELELRTLTGLKEMRSISAQNFGAVILEFDVSFDKDQAMLDVREKMDQARSELPDDAEEPDIREFNAGLFPVIMVNLTSTGSERELYTYAKKLKEEITGMLSCSRRNLSAIAKKCWKSLSTRAPWKITILPRVNSTTPWHATTNLCRPAALPARVAILPYPCRV